MAYAQTAEEGVYGPLDLRLLTAQPAACLDIESGHLPLSTELSNESMATLLWETFWWRTATWGDKVGEG